MPSVVAAAVTGLIGVAIKAITIKQAILSVALAGISHLLSPKASASAVRHSITVTARDPMAPREIVYGKVRKGGTYAYIAKSGTNQDLHLVIMLAGHEVEALEEIYFGDELAFNAAGTAQGRFVGFATVTKYLGTSGQTADANLIAAFPGVWTSDHRLRGIAYIYIKLTFNADVYRSVPNISAVIKGKKVFDSRTSITAWSDNAALCTADYLNDSTYGLGAPHGTEIPAAELNAAANTCDELVSIPPSGTEKRYTCNGVISSSEEPQRSLEALLSAMQGSCIFSGGQWIIKAGAYEAPTLTLDENDLRGRMKVQPRRQRRELFNSVRGIYRGEKTQWQPADFPPLKGTTFITQDNGETIWHDVALPFTVTETMAERLAKIELYAAREQISVEYPCSLKALQRRAGDTIGITNTRTGWTNKPFFIADWDFATFGDDADAPILGCLLRLRETSAAVYDITAGEQTLVNSSPDSALPTPFTVGAITGLALTSTGEQLLDLDGTVIPRIKVTWDAVTDEFVKSGGRIEVQFKKSADSTWLPSAYALGADTSTYIHGVQDGVNYDVRVRPVNTLGVHGAFTTVSNHTVASHTTAPATPSGLVVSVGTGKVIELRWTESTEADLDVYQVFRSTTNDSATAAKIADARTTKFIDSNVAYGTPYFYWIKAADRSGNISGFHPGQFAGVSATPAQIASADILDAAITATKVNTKIVIVLNDTWTDNSPVAGSIAWNAHTLVYTGTVYSIAGGNTANKYILFQPGISTTVYQTYTQAGFDALTLADNDFVIAINNGGIHDIAWNSHEARQFISSAFIADAAIINAKIANLAVTNAKISDMAADKITTGLLNVLVGLAATGSPSITLDGANRLITITDQANVGRIRIGKVA